ncbi:DgyrCDS5871 [Dimorphilus gyrociliatus]|uniref:ubiquitinyl hydrolase 1 n=1 Tax=Dimorphilus gyrociliatus TaxID=2664684 RepID=A0A7I8VMT7_9ANNE|nr:DgyrCDS5871 [Dimorphilus gyrociliatus]
MTDHSPEFGTVRWIGYLAELKESSWTVGVDFDNPIGTGTGKYKDQQLFKTAVNHASLIPIMGLMRVSELGLPDPKYTPKNIPSRVSATIPRTRQNTQDHVNSKHNFIRASTPDRSDNSPWERRTPPTTMNYSTNGGTGMGSGSISTPLREGDPSYNIIDKVGRPKGRANAAHSANLSPAVNPRDLLPKDCNSDDVETMSLEKRAGAAVKKQAKAAKNAIMNQLKRKKASVGSGGGSGGGDSTANTSTDSETFNLDDLASSLGRGILSSNTRNARQSSESEGGSLATPPQSKPPSKAPSKSGSSDERGKTSSPKPLDPASLNTQLSYGSMVEVNSEDGSHFGVARWFGYKEDINSPIVGLEMDDLNSEENNSTQPTPKREGVLGGKSLFECTSGGKPAFYPLKVCQRDRRFEENAVSRNGAGQHSPFGNVDCPEVIGHVDPLSFDCIADLNPYCGKNKGIQGHRKSCYLDTTLFSMFAFTSVFDEILCRPKKEADIICFEEIQTILRESVVNPLRKNFFVRADKVLNLRGMLDKNSSVKGLTNEEKDPEEFLECLLQQAFVVSPPYLRLSSGVNAYYYQLFVEKDDCVLPNTQHLLGLSFFQNDLKLMSVPSVLILQMPRCGKDFKMYPKIIPSLYLDITDVLEYSVRQCAICGTIATLECRECFSHFGNSLDKIAFCAPCSNRSHGHQRRKHHRPRPLKSPNDAKYRSNMSLASLDSRRETLTADEVSCREVMELFAVICIRTSHYVAYCKTACSEKAPWVFFDSMADREGICTVYSRFIDFSVNVSFLCRAGKRL